MTTEVVAFPDAEAAVIGYLNLELGSRGDAARVSTKVPNPRPERLVKVTRVGGTRANIIQDSPMLTFECWDTNGPDAFALCRLVRALVWAMPDKEGTVYRVRETGGPAAFPDPDTDLPRYQFTAQILMRGEAI